MKELRGKAGECVEAIKESEASGRRDATWSAPEERGIGTRAAKLL